LPVRSARSQARDLERPASDLNHIPPHQNNKKTQQHRRFPVRARSSSNISVIVGQCRTVHSSGGAFLFPAPRHINPRQRVTQQRMNVMTSKITGLLAATLIIASASVASAATLHKAARHYQDHRGSVYLLEDTGARAAGPGTAAAENFQSQWDVSY
jgi:hypothetical protein